MAARASRLENQDAIDSAIVGMLADPKEVSDRNQTIICCHSSSIFKFFIIFLFLNLLLRKARAGIQEVHFLPFNPTDKRTALTYIDRDGKMHRVSKGAPEQVTSH